MATPSEEATRIPDPITAPTELQAETREVLFTEPQAEALEALPIEPQAAAPEDVEEPVPGKRPNSPQELLNENKKSLR